MYPEESLWFQTTVASLKKKAEVKSDHLHRTAVLLPIATAEQQQGVSATHTQGLLRALKKITNISIINSVNFQQT